jgi:hypothetical protein
LATAAMTSVSTTGVWSVVELNAVAMLALSRCHRDV